ncbi:MAG: hypothetical protein KGO83_04890 [Paenibacillaceae bacterium]|jgi:two-component system phosphate regulon sensor histidine kinase PhoR|nr:hypothetical protein [Paenibacillaceae bacterium]
MSVFDIGIIALGIAVLVGVFSRRKKNVEPPNEWEQRLRALEAQWNGVIERLDFGMMRIAIDGRIVLANAQALRYVGATEHDVAQHGVRCMRTPPDVARLCMQCAQSRERIREDVWLAQQQCALHVTYAPLDDGSLDVLVVMHDVTDVRRLERVRNEFVANVTHELKTPLAAIQGFAETLRSGALRDEETALQFLHIIGEEAERLNRLIGDVLDLSRMESGALDMHFSPIELGAFVQRTVRMLDAEAAKRAIVLRTEIESEAFIEADEDRLQQILINVLANAIAYAHDGGVVCIRIEEAVGDASDGGSTRIVVRDEGIGIPQEDVPRIFERFYRVDKARTRTSGGTGLGLSIVKHLVECHRGRISIDSEVGVGTTVAIELPNVQW